MAQLSLRYANLGDVFHNPLVYQGSLFVIPQGRSKVRDGEAVLQVDVASLASKTHAIGRSGMNDVAVNDEYVFTCDSSCINRCRIDNGDVSKIAIEGVYVSKIVWCEDSLYAFALSLDDDSSMIAAPMIRTPIGLRTPTGRLCMKAKSISAALALWKDRLAYSTPKATR